MGEPIGEEALRLVRYLSFKMDCLREQEANPLTVDVELCEDYLLRLEAMKEEKVEALKKAMPKNPIMKKKDRPKVLYKKDGSLSSHGEKWFETLRELKMPDDVQTVTYVDDYEDGNPNSNEQVKRWLFELGWKPRTWKYIRNKNTGEERRIEQVRKDGHLCESVVELVSKDSAIELLDGLTVITHRIGVLKGFLKAHKEGKVVSSAGGFTNTLRLQHRAPVVNLPGVEAVYGEWCRGVIVAPDENQVLCGADISSLESCTKRHYMWPYDPEYVKDMAQPGFDEHLDLAKHAGKITQEDIDRYNKGEAPELKAVRKVFKPANYAGIYGVREKTLSRQTGMSERECAELLDAYWKRNWSVKKIAKAQYVKTLKDGSKWLKNPVSGLYYSLRAEKDIFSTLNQGTGVFVFDMWVMYCRLLGLTINMQYHDEILFSVEKGQERPVSETLHKAMEKVNERLSLNVVIEVEEQYGNSYASVH